jgi:hypothetical protein
MLTNKLTDMLSDRQRLIIAGIDAHASELLDHTPRFKYFTLHGRQHIGNVFRNVDLLIEAGLPLRQEQAFLLGCAICIHDLGMVAVLGSGLAS